MQQATLLCREMGDQIVRETGSVQDLETIGRKAGHGLQLGVLGLKRAHQYISQPHGTAGETASKLAKEGFPMVSRIQHYAPVVQV